MEMTETDTARRIHVLQKLPYGLDALAPHISRVTLEYHYGKHHRGYVDKLNKLVEGSSFEDRDLENIVRFSDGAIFNNAAQVWNHDFYWNSLSPEGGGAPSGALADAIYGGYGSLEAFKKEFDLVATSKFGSGWTWVIRHGSGSVAIKNTDNADTPIRHNQWPLLVCDVWEHAYYLDHKNNRAAYLEAFWQLANWKFAGARYAAAEDRE
jgi:superoxide dismutase, Fe-Mn family